MVMLVVWFTTVDAQYIADVFEFVPAPGQFTNSVGWGTPAATNSIVGGVNGSMCLGAFGGYVVFGFEQPVENHPDNPYGIDFTIFGNPAPHWSEPGVVWVMKDINGNGWPDDTWYELAGSDSYFSSTVRGYTVTYFNPGDTTARDVPWSDNLGNNGQILSNSAHLQPYYPHADSFPAIPVDQYSLSGTRIEITVDSLNPTMLSSPKRAFGYVDNQIRGNEPFTKPDNPYTPEMENSGGDAFDLDWAVDTLGQYVELDAIDFVKVQNGVQAHGGWLGEISTEITGAIDVAPDPSLSGEEDLIVIRDLPALLKETQLQLEAFVFHGGRLQSDRDIQWTSSLAEASVDEYDLLRVSGSGDLTLTASLVDRPEIRTTVTTIVKLDHTAVKQGKTLWPEIALFPNPATDHIRIAGVDKAAVSMFDTSGKHCLQIDAYADQNMIDLTPLTKGIYLVKIHLDGGRVKWNKLLVE